MNMGVGSWGISTIAPCRVPLIVDGVAVTSGTCTIELSRKNGATVEWLQDDLTTWTSTYNTIAGDSDTERGFGLDLTVPTSAQDYQVDWLVRHSVYGALGGGANNVVSSLEGGSGGGGGSTVGLEVTLAP